MRIIPIVVFNYSSGRAVTLVVDGIKSFSSQQIPISSEVQPFGLTSNRQSLGMLSNQASIKLLPLKITHGGKAHPEAFICYGFSYEPMQNGVWLMASTATYEP